MLMLPQPLMLPVDFVTSRSYVNYDGPAGRRRIQCCLVRTVKAGTMPRRPDISFFSSLHAEVSLENPKARDRMA